MVWSAKAINTRKRDYVIIRHKLGNLDDTIIGVRFRSGYAVVDKTSKVYKQLKKLPFLKNALEFPLLHLEKLSFIVNDRQVETVYGKDVYVNYIAAKREKVESAIAEAKAIEEAHIAAGYCKYQKEDGSYCKRTFLQDNGYCTQHAKIVADKQQ